MHTALHCIAASAANLKSMDRVKVYGSVHGLGLGLGLGCVAGLGLGRPAFLEEAEESLMNVLIFCRSRKWSDLQPKMVARESGQDGLSTYIDNLSEKYLPLILLLLSETAGFISADRIINGKTFCAISLRSKHS